MIIDNTLVFSDGQPITATAASTNVVDLKATGTAPGAAAALSRDIGAGGCRIPLAVEITESFNNLTSMAISIEKDDNEAFSSATTVYTTPAILLANLSAGAKVNLPDYIPEGTDEEFIRLKYTVTGTAPTTGKVFAAVVMARQTN